MKNYKKMSILLIIVMITSIFTGCSMEEKALLDAIIKNQEIRDLESTSRMEFKMSVEGLDEESQASYEETIGKINGMKVRMDQKAITNEEQTLVKGEVDINVQLTDMSFDSSIWVDTDLRGEEVYMNQIYRLPSLMMDSISGAEGKQYVILNMDEMNESILEEDAIDPIEMEKTMAIAMKYQDKFMDAYLEYLKKYDSDLNLVTKLDEKIVDGEKIQYYEVKFDDESFKEFLKYTSISILKDENILLLFEEYMEELVEVTGEEIEEDISLTENLKETIEDVKEFFEKIEDLNLLGEDGITITYGINEEGYFVSEVGSMNFKMDTSQLEELDFEIEDLEEIEEEDILKDMPTPIIELFITYDTEITRINEGLEIVMPETTEENSIGYMELLDMMLEESMAELEDMDLMVILEDEFIEFTNPPINVNDRYHVSSRDMAKAFGADIAWNGETKEITINKGETKLVFNAETNDLLINDKLEEIDTSVVIIDGVSFIPLRAVSENLGYNIDWDGEFNFVSIYKEN